MKLFEIYNLDSTLDLSANVYYVAEALQGAKKIHEMNYMGEMISFYVNTTSARPIICMVRNEQYEQFLRLEQQIKDRNKDKSRKLYPFEYDTATSKLEDCIVGYLLLIKRPDKFFGVSVSYLDEDYRGKGMGMLLYDLAILYIGPLASGEGQTESSKRIWKHFIENPGRYEVKAIDLFTGNDVSVMFKNGNLVDENGIPVYDNSERFVLTVKSKL